LLLLLNEPWLRGLLLLAQLNQLHSIFGRPDVEHGLKVVTCGNVEILLLVLAAILVWRGLRWLRTGPSIPMRHVVLDRSVNFLRPSDSFGRKRGLVKLSCELRSPSMVVELSTIGLAQIPAHAINLHSR
jgi:hypothetical protein